MDDDLRIERGSGNVFADLAVPNPETALLKADLAFYIDQAIGANNWTTDEAANELHVDPETLDAVIRGRLGSLSTDELLHILRLLDFDVTITIGPNTSSRRSAQVVVRPQDEAPGVDVTSIQSAGEGRVAPGAAKRRAVGC